MIRKPLEGIRVIDFCWVGAGSYATKLLADQGADVIKIESSARVDGIRLSAPFAGGKPGVNRSGYFADRNSSKRSCTINMKTAKGREIARRLIADCDVVTNSFTPGVMERFGLDWESVHEINPRAVYLAMSMQGDGGPERYYMGYGLTISGVVGLHAMSAMPGRLPVGTGTNYPDHIPNPCHAAFAVLAALRHVRRTGQGQFIDLAQTEATISVLGPSILEAQFDDRDPEPLGNGHRRFHPHGVYPASGDDRWVAIAVADDAQRRVLADVLGTDDLSDSASIASATVEWDATDLAIALQERGVAAAPVEDAADVVERDPQLAHRNHWVWLEHPEMGETVYNAPPFRFSGLDGTIRTAAPMLGQHTEQVCRELLGMDPDEVAALVEDGVLV